METIKKYKLLLIPILLVLAGIFFFFNMYINDIKALKDFVISYEKFDKAISDFSVSKTDELEKKADDALVELNTKATLRISSLIKNDRELMDKAREVTNLSGKEFDCLKDYRLTKECGDLTNERKVTYINFQSLHD